MPKWIVVLAPAWQVSYRHRIRSLTIQIDRPLGSRHPQHSSLCLLNYGYLPGVLGTDGEELDANVLDVFEPVERFEGR